MHYLTWLIIVAGLVFLVCLGLLKLIQDLFQMSVHESPAMPESLRRPANAEQPPAKTDSYELSSRELGGTQ
jgi:hypothetical protein